MKTIEIVANTVDEAIEKAVDVLGVERESIEVQILSEEKKGLFGMPGGKKAKIRATIKEKTS